MDKVSQGDQGGLAAHWEALVTCEGIHAVGLPVTFDGQMA